MNPFEGTLIRISSGNGRRVGNVTVKGAIQHVWLDLVPEARIGDILICDACVAVACVPSGKTTEEKHYVSRHTR